MSIPKYKIGDNVIIRREKILCLMKVLGGFKNESDTKGQWNYYLGCSVKSDCVDIELEDNIINKL